MMLGGVNILALPTAIQDSHISNLEEFFRVQPYAHFLRCTGATISGKKSPCLLTAYKLFATSQQSAQTQTTCGNTFPRK